MGVGKKKAGKVKITLKIAKNSVRLTADGKRRLDLSKRGIDSFPKCLLKLADVDELDLSRNLLQKLPESISVFVNLRCLDLHSNRIERLPEAIGKLQGLRHLNLCDNRLGPEAPVEICSLWGLRSLNLGMNRIETLPPAIKGLTELRELWLFDNLLAELPDEVRKLPNVHKLNAERNPFAKADAIANEEKDLAARATPLYLRSEKDLCEDCLENSRERREGLNGWGGSRQPIGKDRFPGLSTPNSVAWETQGLWRVRQPSAM